MDFGSNNGAAITVRGLAKRYGEVEAVGGIDFDVRRGETFGFLGPNGAGKTTTINMLCTLATPTAGSATVAGYDVATQRDEVRRNIGLVFQDTTLDGYLTAERNLRFHAELYGVPHAVFGERMKEVMEMVGLWDRRGSRVQTFSGGMMRRLEIARGLLHSPHVLFLDEPTIGLDPQTRVSIWRYIAELRQREDTTIFLTTHYMDEAENCDRIAIIDNGTIVALDTPEALKASVGTDRVQIQTSDDQAAIAALRERFGIEAGVHEDAVTFSVPEGEQFVPGCSPSWACRSDPSAWPGRPWTTCSCPIRGRPSGTRRRPTRSGRSSRRSGGGKTTMATQAATVSPTPAPVRLPARTVRHDLRAVRIVWQRELIRFFQDRPRIISSLLQPILFLFVLGTGLSTLASGGTGGLSLRTFMFPGVLAMATMFTALFSAGSIVWDREFGFLREMLVAPVRRSAIVLGKVLGGATVATFQATVVLSLAGAVGVPYSPALLLTLVIELLILSFTLTALGVMIAARMRNIQTFFAMTQLFLLPMLFLSGALYPLSNLPTWLKTLTRIDPITYIVDPMRRAVFEHLDIPSFVNRRLNPGVTWGAWRVPTVLELAIVIAIGLAMLGVGVAQFSRTD